MEGATVITTVVGSGREEFYGREFSWGDNFIFECAQGVHTGNLRQWVTVDTNHHIRLVSEQLANLDAP